MGKRNQKRVNRFINQIPWVRGENFRRKMLVEGIEKRVKT